MKRTIKQWIGSISFIFLLAGCGPTVHVQKDEKNNFSHYKTFTWIDKDGKGKNDHNSSNDLLEQKMREAVTAELEKNTGWKEARRKPDVYLTYDVLVEKTLQQKSDPVYAQPFSRSYYSPFSRRYFDVLYPSQFVGYDNYSVPVKEGTVTISLIDARKGKTVWQGWTTDEVDSQNLSDKEIENSVKAIFKKFDIAKN